MANQTFGNTYKQKVLLLSVGSVLFLVLAWYLSFSKTFTEYRKMTIVKERLQQAERVEQEIAQLQSSLAAYKKDSLVQQFSQERLFELVTEWCQEHDLIVQAMPEAKFVEQDGYRIYTNELHLKGAYVQIVELMYALERTFKIGQLVHGDFSLVKNRDTKRLELLANLHLKNIEPLAKK